MSIPISPEPAQLVLSILSSQWDELWPNLLNDLTSRFGPTDMISELIPFTETTYYDSELGVPIFRRLISFANLVPMEELPAIKLWTNQVEQAHTSLKGQRQMNLDPGLVTFERLVLATGKNFTHRIYLSQGIWADLTLIFQKGIWQDLPWTFPDYAGPVLKEHLTKIRLAYAEKITALRANKKETLCSKV